MFRIENVISVLLLFSISIASMSSNGPIVDFDYEFPPCLDDCENEDNGGIWHTDSDLFNLIIINESTLNYSINDNIIIPDLNFFGDIVVQVQVSDEDFNPNTNRNKIKSERIR